MRHEASFVNAVLHRDYRRAYWDGLPALLAEPREIRVWKPLRGDFAASPG